MAISLNNLQFLIPNWQNIIPKINVQNCSIFILSSRGSLVSLEVSYHMNHMGPRQFHIPLSSTLLSIHQNPIVPHQKPLSSTLKTAQFYKTLSSTPKPPQFHTKNPSVQHSHQRHIKNLPVQNKKLTKKL